MVNAMDDSPNLNRAVSPLSDEVATHPNYYIFVDTPANLTDARDTCSAMQTDPNGCYLMHMDDVIGTDDYILTLLANAFNRSQELLWLNYEVVNGTIFSGINGLTSSYLDGKFVHDNDSDAMAYIADHPNASLNDPGGTWMNVESSAKLSYFCECVDVCQHGVGACASFEECSIIDEYTADCGCPALSTGSNCESCMEGYTGMAPFNCEVDGCTNDPDCVHGSCVDMDDYDMLGYACDCHESGYTGP